MPTEAYYMGLAGTIPYLGTSLATVLCAYEINHSVGGQGNILSEHTATHLLHLLEPIQIGYGASVRYARYPTCSMLTLADNP